MKTFWDLTGRERLALTKEQIETIYVPREAAEAGLLVPREPILEPLPPEPDVERPKGRNVFIVNVSTEEGSSNTINVAFATQEQAEAFIALNPMYYTSRWRRSKSMNTATPCESIELQIACVTTEKEEDAYAKAREEYESALGRNADKTNTYERELQKVKNSAERIWKNWNKLRERES